VIRKYAAIAAKQAADMAATRNVRRTLRSNLGRFHIGGHLARTELLAAH
jgi:hypothetical protein